MLTDADIRREGLIRNGHDANFRSASYDLRIGHLISPTGEVVGSYNLPPQGIVEVISEEEVLMPKGVAGIAMVKTKLCQEGVLALSIGIIDPCFEGRVSSFMVNFGKSPRLLQRGETFLRTVYQRLDGEAERLQPAKLDYQEMMRERRRASVERFEPTFLSVDTLVSKSADEIFAKYKNRALAYVSAIALFLALLTFLVNFGTIWLKWQDPPPAPVAANAIADLTRRNEELARRLELIERQLPKPMTSTARTPQ